MSVVEVAPMSVLLIVLVLTKQNCRNKTMITLEA